MKKITRENLIKLLKENKDYTYDELSQITGYHPKSLIRINSQIKKDNYKIKKNIKSKLGIKIKEDYLNSNLKTYKDFYSQYKEKYNISYPMMCRIISSLTCNEKTLLIKKLRIKGNYHFQIIDIKTQTLLFEFPSIKNDEKSLNKILFKLLSEFGKPKYIIFSNFYKKLPDSINNILKKYQINLEKHKPYHRISTKKLNTNNNNISYSKCPIDKKDFYNNLKRKTIANNIIQFNNIRYQIISTTTIKRNTTTTLYYNDNLDDIFITYNNKEYYLNPLKEITSKKGNTKY